MAEVFISYSSKGKNKAKNLLEDLQELGKSVWMDNSLHGGQEWWSQILEQIRACELFIFVLDPHSLESVACQREFEYAAALGKPVLPVLVAEGVSIELLPPALSKIHYVDCRKDDRASGLSLAKSVESAPAPSSLPDPMPAEPEAPISVLASLAERVGSEDALSKAEQSDLLLDIKRLLREPNKTDDAVRLLKRLSDRDDLFAAIDDEITEIVGSDGKPAKKLTPNKSVSKQKKNESQARSSKANESQNGLREKLCSSRFRYVLTLSVSAGILSLIAMLLEEGWSSKVWFGLLAMPPAAIVGAVVWRDKAVSIAAAVGGVIGLLWATEDQNTLAAGIMLGGPYGAFVTALLGWLLFAFLRRLQWWRS